MFTAFTRATSLRRWIARPDCPPFLRECQLLFTKTFGGGRANTDSHDDEIPQSAFSPTPPALRGIIAEPSVALRARHQHDNVGFSRATTHVGNSLILYYPSGNFETDPIPGSIQYIIVKKNMEVVYAVHTQIPAPADTVDPFRFYPHFPAKIYSPSLSSDLSLVQPTWVLSHYARWKLDEDRVVVLTLSRVSNVEAKLWQAN